MKVYLASSFKLVDYVKSIYYNLDGMGIQVTVKWWEKDFKKVFGDITDNEWYSLFEIEEIRKRNFNGIDEADALILVCHPKETRKFNGANVEVGYALAKGKPVYSVGALERSGMYQEVRRFSNPYDLIEVLLTLKEETKEMIP